MATQIGLIALPQRSLCCRGRVRAEISSGILFLFLSNTLASFSSQENFGRDENKISNKVHFFLVDFEGDF
jgi:hypothetical protein